MDQINSGLSLSAGPLLIIWVLVRAYYGPEPNADLFSSQV